MDDLLSCLDDMIARNRHQLTFVVPAQEGKVLAWLHGHGAVLQQKIEGSMLTLDVVMEQYELDKGGVWIRQYLLSDAEGRVI